MRLQSTCVSSVQILWPIKSENAAEELNPSTLQARRAAADVRAVWRHASTAGPRGGSVSNQGVRPV
jgi:hypothetical protein